MQNIVPKFNKYNVLKFKRVAQKKNLQSFVGAGFMNLFSEIKKSYLLKNPFNKLEPIFIKSSVILPSPFWSKSFSSTF